MRAAQHWNQPPSVMWTGHTEWSERDRLLALALEMYEQSIDPDCGHSQYLAGDPEYDGHYRIGSRTCMACKAVEQWQDSTEAKNAKTRHGQKRYLWMKLFNPNGGDDDG